MVRWLGIAMVGVAACAAGAQETMDVTWSPWQDAAAPQLLWQLRFDPQVWYAAPAGEVKLPGSPEAAGRSDIELFGLDSPALSPAGRLTLQRGAWRLGFTASSVGVSTGSTMAVPGQIGSVVFSAGDYLESEVRLTNLQAVGGYRLFEARRGEWGGDSSRLVFGVDAFVGLRAQQFEYGVRGPSGERNTDEWFAYPIVGADIEVDLWKSVSVALNIEGGAAGGYDDKTVGSGAIEVGFAWRPWENFGATIGYRLEALGLSQGDGDEALEFQGSTAGLLFGLTLRF